MASFFQHSLTRDCVFLRKGDTLTAKLHSSLTTWTGGSFVQWIADGTGEPCVRLADGRFCGILPSGSSESADQWNNFTEASLLTGVTTVVFGGNLFATRSYETLGYLARNGLGPQVPLVYTANQKLYVSENGLITNENESDLGTYGAHNYPNGDAVVDMSHDVFGLCAVPPHSNNLSMGTQYIVVQTNLGL